MYVRISQHQGSQQSAFSSHNNSDIQLNDTSNACDCLCTLLLGEICECRWLPPERCHLNVQYMLLCLRMPCDDAGIGYGVQRLKGFKTASDAISGGQRAEEVCANVANLRFTGAVIDNFAPVEEQQFWEGEGQRYWVNQELWGTNI